MRLFVGNGGPDLISSFHVIGEIFDRVYSEASMGGDLKRHVQTTLIPAGGAAIAEFKVDVPGRFLLVDHSISRAMDKGALGAIVVAGDERPDIFKALTPEIAKRHSGHWFDGGPRSPPGPHLRLGPPRRRRGGRRGARGQGPRRVTRKQRG